MVPREVPDTFLTPDSPPRRELRKAKSSLLPPIPGKSSMLNIITRKRSKSRVRGDSEDAEHPSLRTPPPPLPDYSSFLPLGSGSPPHPSFIKETKRPGKKKKDLSRQGSSNPEDDIVMTIDTNFDQMDGIVDQHVLSSSMGASGSTSPGSGLDSSSHTRSLSDHSNSTHATLPPILPSEFKNPFTAIPPPRTSSLPHNKSTERKISPRTIALEQPSKPPNVQMNGSKLKENKNGAADGSWVAPESWGVQGENAEEDGGYSGSEDDTNQNTPPFCPEASQNFQFQTDGLSNGSLYGSSSTVLRGRVGRNGHYRNDINEMGQLYDGTISTLSIDSETISTADSLGRRIERGRETPSIASLSSKAPMKTIRLRIYLSNNTYHVVHSGFSVTVESLTLRLNEKLGGKMAYRLYLKENGRGTHFVFGPL